MATCETMKGVGVGNRIGDSFGRIFSWKFGPGKDVFNQGVLEAP